MTSVGLHPTSLSKWWLNQNHLFRVCHVVAREGAGASWPERRLRRWFTRLPRASATGSRPRVSPGPLQLRPLKGKRWREVKTEIRMPGKQFQPFKARFNGSELHLWPNIHFSIHLNMFKWTYFVTSVNVAVVAHLLVDRLLLVLFCCCVAALLVRYSWNEPVCWDLRLREELHSEQTRTRGSVSPRGRQSKGKWAYGF